MKKAILFLFTLVVFLACNNSAPTVQPSDQDHTQNADTGHLIKPDSSGHKGNDSTR